ncbi:hypothetical protein HCA69_02575 [Listeria grandensis]|uniref:HTH cro/C1-type domain-containing protein n=1 Tax=Listeria grandensis TaxID=1494963 RepID=A0A7X0Y1N7_9LIST|nr:hypothetical protein [Listeria grandensis]MBC1935234.1 hypothetical protein [Listeria grandensis]
MKSIGETIRHIRILKGFRQQDFSELTQAAIASIESSKRNITLDKLMSVLKDFKMSLREFEYIRNDYQLSPTDDIFFDFTNTKHSIDREQGNIILKRAASYLVENPSDFIIYCMYVLEDVFLKISAQNTYDIDSPESCEIWKTLHAREGWTYQEVFIMSKLFFIFPLDTGVSIIKRIEKEMNRYLNFCKDINFDVSFYANVGKYYTHKRQFSLAKNYLNLALPLCQKYDKPSIENDAYAHLAIIDYLNGKSDAEKEVYECIQIFRTMRRPALAEDLESDWNTFFKEKVLI